MTLSVAVALMFGVTNVVMLIIGILLAQYFFLRSQTLGKRDALGSVSHKLWIAIVLGLVVMGLSTIAFCALVLTAQ
jgi:hypothetical protein